MNEEETKERLRRAIESCADEIKEYGFGALWGDGEQVIEGTIVINIGTDMHPSIQFIREVYPKGFVRK